MHSIASFVISLTAAPLSVAVQLNLTPHSLVDKAIRAGRVAMEMEKEYFEGKNSFLKDVLRSSPGVSPAMSAKDYFQAYYTPVATADDAFVAALLQLPKVDADRVEDLFASDRSVISDLSRKNFLLKLMIAGKFFLSNNYTDALRFTSHLGLKRILREIIENERAGLSIDGLKSQFRTEYSEVIRRFMH
jgi:hypothetical protein